MKSIVNLLHVKIYETFWMENNNAFLAKIPASFVAFGISSLVSFHDPLAVIIVTSSCNNLFSLLQWNKVIRYNFLGIANL